MEKFKSYLKKSMFERINGVDIEKLQTSELLRQIKLLPILFIIVIVCAIVILLLGVFMAAIMIADGEFDGALMSLMFFPFAISCIFLAFIFPKRLKNVKATLDSREIDEKIQEEANKKLAETKKYSIIGLIAIVTVSVIFVAVFVIGGFNSSYKNSDVCSNCGQDKKLVAGHDLCYDCFEGYLEWQDRKYK